MMVSNHLFKMPIVSTLVKAHGHLAVPFKQAGESGGFEIDQEKMKQRMRQLEDHADEGGSVAWFPEGTINKGDPLKLGSFRAGGFKLPLHVDAEIWCMAFVGN